MLFQTVHLQKTVKSLRVTTKFIALQHIKIAISLIIFVTCLFCFVNFVFRLYHQFNYKYCLSYLMLGS